MNAHHFLSTLDKVGFQMFGTLLSILWQSTILLAAAALLAFAMRRRSPALRHAIWIITVLAIPLLPLAGWVAPKVGTPQAELRVMPSYSAAPQNILAPEPNALPVAEPLLAANAPTPDRHPWALLLIGYALGVAILLSLVGLGRIRLRRCLREAAPIEDARTCDLLDEIRRALGIKRSVTALETSLLRVPITLGLLRPVVLLPRGLALQLSDRELEAVLIHELSHIKRNDPLTLSLLSYVRALLFFHPLVWLACRRISVLAESACDDAVLEAGSEPTSYARMLTRLAESLPRRAVTAELAAGIILSRSAFVNRVKAILSDRRYKMKKLPRIMAAATVVVAALSLYLAAALPLKERAPSESSEIAKSESTPVAAEQAQPASVQLASNWKATLSTGVIVELLGISYHPSKAQAWWKPDGSPLAEPPYERTASGVSGTGAEYRYYEIAVRLRNLPSTGLDGGWEYCEPVDGGWVSSPPWGAYLGGQRIEDIVVCVVRKPVSARALDLRFGLAGGEWHTLHTFEYNGLGTKGIGFQGGGITLSAGTAKEGISITAGYNITDLPARLVAVDRSGKVHEPKDTRTAGVKGFTQMTLAFPDLDFSQIKEFQFQERIPRPDLVEFKNISLRPAADLPPKGPETAVTPAPSPAETRQAWGDAVEGVEASLRADRRVWKAGETPSLSLDVRNRGPRELRIARTQVTCEVEVDGKWYTWHGVTNRSSEALPRGGQVRGIVVSLFDIWREKTDQSGIDTVEGTKHDKPLKLPPGPHTVRVACQPEYGAMQTVRAVSNAVEIQILPGTPPASVDDWGASVEGVRCRLRAEKAVWRAGEVPMLRADARNQSNREMDLIPVQGYFEVEVDGSWYKWTEGIVLVMLVRPFSPGTELIGISISLDGRWGLKKGEGRLALTPGKHVIRVACMCQGVGAERDVGIRAISNPVEIQILRGATPAAADKPGQPVEEAGSADDEAAKKAVAKIETRPGREQGVAALPRDVLVVTEGIDRAVREMLRQATGKALFLAYWEHEMIDLRFDFVLDGEKFRWDRHVVKWVRDGKDVSVVVDSRVAYDGHAAYEAMRLFENSKWSAYVHPAKDYAPLLNYRPYGGYYTGVAFNPRGLLIPQDFSNAGDTFTAIIQDAFSHGADVTVKGDPRKDDSVVLEVGYEGVNRGMYVNVADGFLITKEELVSNGDVRVLSLREYDRDKQSGAMVLQRYLEPSGDPARPRLEISIQYESVNQPVPARLFTLEGFGLPPDVTAGDLRQREARTRYFVLIVAGEDSMTFEGKQTTWDELPSLLEKIPDRANTVLCLAAASDELTLREDNDAQSRAKALARQFGFEYFSHVGIHPLGSKGGPPQLVPAK